VKALPKEEFAHSLGLVEAPALGDFGDAADIEKNPLKKQKNQTALQRLRDRIKQKKQEKTKAGAEARPDGSGGVAKEETDEEEEMEQDKVKKLGRWERRQKKIQKAAEKQKSETPKAVAIEDDLLQLVEEEREVEIAAPTGVHRQKLKLRRDGQAIGAQGKHTFFTGEKAKSSGELAALVEDMQDADEEPATASGGREAFLRSVAKDLASRDKSDAALSRARIHERHQKLKRKEKQDRRGIGDEDIDEGMELASASGGDSDSDAGGRGDASSRSPSLERGPPTKRKRGPATWGAARVADADAAPDSGGADLEADDPLGALERQALGRLGGSSLFS